MNIKLIRFLDRYIGGLICFFLGLLPSRKKVGGNKILAIQLWGVGESILTLPALRELKNAKVLVTERNKDVYMGYNDVDVVDVGLIGVVSHITRNWNKYDVVVDFEEYLNVSAIIAFFVGRRRIGYSHGIRSWLYTDKVKYNDKQHCSQTFMDLLRPMGIRKEVRGLLQVKYSGEDRKKVDRIIKEKDLKNIAGISSGVAESAKCRMWPIERLAKVCDYLVKERDMAVVFLGTKNERILHDNIIKLMREKSTNLCGELTLSQTVCFIERCNLVTSNDSGIMHIGASMGTKTVGLFGPNLPVRFGPVGGISIYKGEICKYSPCINVHKGEVPDCYYRGKDYQKCMKNISVGDVISRIK